MSGEELGASPALLCGAEGQPDDLDQVVAAGFDAVRFVLDWRRAEPEPGRFDDAVFARYAALIEGCRPRGLEPVVTLVGGPAPAWMGAEAWTRPDAPQLVAAWSRAVADRLGEQVRRWVTVRRPTAVALDRPDPRRFQNRWAPDVGRTVRSLDHLLASHVAAFTVLKERYPTSIVTTTFASLPVYELGQMLSDILLAPSAGIARHELGAWLSDRKSAHDDSAGTTPMTATLARRVIASTLPLNQALPQAVASVFDSSHPTCLDAISLDLVEGGHPLAGFLEDHVASPDQESPATQALAAAAELAPHLGVWLGEPESASQADEVPTLRRTLDYALALVDRGIPVTAIFSALPHDSAGRAATKSLLNAARANVETDPQ